MTIIAATLLLVAGCGGGGKDESTRSGATTTATTGATSEPKGTATTETPASTVPRPSPEKKPGLLPLPPCPAGSANCSSARGRIIYVEAVDPDGDGDAHFVLASAEAITGPGISVIDVRADLRPAPLPAIGDQLSASGPVYRGSHGQRQIQADVVLTR